MKNYEDIISYCIKCGNKYSEDNFDMEESAFVCDKCGHKFHINPIPTVGAVVPRKDADEVLISTRGINPFKGKLETPGGFVDTNEAPREAIKRELKEELNLNLHIKEVIHTSKLRYQYQSIMYPLNCIYFISDPVDELPKELEYEVQKVQFMNLDQIKSKKNDFAFIHDYDALIKYFM
jgi:ADP-ribose pyrophosphatase YjhB (NUDIX family)